MSAPTIWLSSPHMSGNEMKYINEAFERNLVMPLGPNVTGLEDDIRKFTGSKGCSCLSSGTAALHLALINLGIEQGDEVICSSFTFSASANPIVYQKAIPVFVDSEQSTWNMDPVLLQEAIADRIAKTGKKPKAIILVHLYGMPARMDEIMQVAMMYDIPVIEDAAEAFGSTYKGKPCGTFGEIGILSFNGNKIITTSGGGALISDNEEYCKNATFLATQARDAAPHYQHSHIGYNYRMSNISAGIGRGQMEVLNDRIAKRRENFFFYKQELEKIQGIEVFTEPGEEYFSNHWLSTLLVNRVITGCVSRETLDWVSKNKTLKPGLSGNPCTCNRFFRNYPSYTNGTSEFMFENGLCLPSSSNITDEERQRVVDAVRKLCIS